MNRKSPRAAVALVLMLVTVLQASVWAQEKPPVPKAIEKTQQLLSGISSEEKRVTAALFEIAQTIDRLKDDQRVLENKMNLTRNQIAEKQRETTQEKDKFLRIQSALGETLRARQRAGAASGLDMLLSASSLRDLLHRINMLRDLSRTVSQQMDAIENSRKTLLAEQKALNQLMAVQMEQQASLLKKQKALKASQKNLEEKLSSLADQRGTYEFYLKQMSDQWDRVAPLIEETVQKFNQLIAAGGLGADVVSLRLTGTGAQGVLWETAFNEALSKEPNLPEMQFQMLSNQVVLTFPRYGLSLEGNLLLKDSKTIVYEVSSGTFNGITLGQGALDGLFKEKSFTFYLKTLIGNNEIKKIEVKKGAVYLWVQIRP